MEGKHFVPLALSVSALSVLSVVSLQQALAPGNIGSVKASSGHGVTQTVPPAPAPQMGATVGASPIVVTTTSITLAPPKPGVG